MDKRRKPNTWKGEFDNSKIELPLLPKIKADINKLTQKHKDNIKKEKKFYPTLFFLSFGLVQTIFVFVKRYHNANRFWITQTIT